MKKSREDEMSTASETAVNPRGTTESLADPDTGLRGDVSSLGSDSEINGFANEDQKIDKYGFVGGAQYTGELVLLNTGNSSRSDSLPRNSFVSPAEEAPKRLTKH